MGDQEIVVYYHPNPELRSFLTRVEICAPRVEYFKVPLTEESDPTLAQLGALGAQIVKAIMLIPGVMEIRIKPKEIQVRKGTTVSWESIQNSIIEVLRHSLKRKQLRIVRPWFHPFRC
jgi:hypothetical protein